MGLNSSNLKTDRTSFSTKDADLSSDEKAFSSVQPYANSMGDFDFSILDDLLVDILSYVSATELITNCRLVCKEWKNLIDGHSIWKEKCQREHKRIPPISFKNLPAHFYMNIYFHEPYGRNLINNPCGEDGTNGWILPENRRNGLMVENPPAGSDPVPLEVGSPSCFSTSFLACTKHQVINLKDLGVPEEVLQLKSTKIQIGEWYAARFDCAAEYKLCVALLGDNYFEEDMEPNLTEDVIDKFEFEFREEQWIGKEWHKVTHTFEDVSKVRYVYFEHYGKDCQFWAGNYGIKMTGAFVKILV